MRSNYNDYVSPTELHELVVNYTMSFRVAVMNYMFKMLPQTIDFITHSGNVSAVIDLTTYTKDSELLTGIYERCRLEYKLRDYRGICLGLSRNSKTPSYILNEIFEKYCLTKPHTTNNVYFETLSGNWNSNENILSHIYNSIISSLNDTFRIYNHQLVVTNLLFNPNTPDYIKRLILLNNPPPFHQYLRYPIKHGFSNEELERIYVNSNNCDKDTIARWLCAFENISYELILKLGYLNLYPSILLRNTSLSYETLDKVMKLCKNDTRNYRILYVETIMKKLGSNRVWL